MWETGRRKCKTGKSGQLQWGMQRTGNGKAMLLEQLQEVVDAVSHHKTAVTLTETMTLFGLLNPSKIKYTVIVFCTHSYQFTYYKKKIVSIAPLMGIWKMFVLLKFY